MSVRVDGGGCEWTSVAEESRHLDYVRKPEPMPVVVPVVVVVLVMVLFRRWKCILCRCRGSYVDLTLQ